MFLEIARNAVLPLGEELILKIFINFLCEIFSEKNQMFCFNISIIGILIPTCGPRTSTTFL